MFRNNFTNAVIKKQNIAKYVLIQLNQYQIGKLGTVDTIPIADITLEHIMPQNEKAQAWSHLKQNHEELVNRLGNLTLLEKNVNRDATDGSFIDKLINVYNKSSLQLNKDLKEYHQWTRDEILDSKNSPSSRSRYGKRRLGF